MGTPSEYCAGLAHDCKQCGAVITGKSTVSITVTVKQCVTVKQHETVIICSGSDNDDGDIKAVVLTNDSDNNLNQY